MVDLYQRDFFHPILAGEQSDQDHHAEKRLGQRGVRRRNRGWQVKEHRNPAQNPLCDNQRQRSQSEIFHPAARVGAPSPDREDDA